MSDLEVRDVRVAFGDVVVLDGVSLHVASGESVALLGPSGSGKSTLLRVIAGIVAPDAGIVVVDGIDVTHIATHRRGVGMVFQDNQLFPHLSTLDNVTFGPKLAGVSRNDRNELGRTWLERVGLAGFGDRNVTELSGGEAKRVALARTLAARTGRRAARRAARPASTANSTIAWRSTSPRLLAPITTLLVTHDPDEAAVVADRIVALADL